MGLSEHRFNYFRGPANNVTPTRTIDLNQAYSEIQGGAYRKLIEELRSLTSEDDQKEYKKTRLPYYVFQGEFSPTKKKSNIVSGSGLFTIDLDHIEDHEILEGYKRDLSQDKELGALLTFVSPRGNGLKIVIRLKDPIVVDPQDPYKADSQMKRVFKAVDHYLQTRYNLKNDEACNNVDRSCFVSYDPQAVLNEDDRSFDWLSQEKLIPAPKPQPVRSAQLLGEIMPVSSDYDRALRAVEDIEASGIDITQGYKSGWLRIGFALATLGEPGRDLFHRVSQLWSKYNPRDTDRQFSACLEGNSENGGPQVNIETLFHIARSYGVKLRPDPEYISNLKKHSTMAENKPYNKPKATEAEEISDSADNAQISPEIDQIQWALKEISKMLTRGDLIDAEESLRGYLGLLSKMVQDGGNDWLLTPTSEEKVLEEESSLPEGLVTGYRIEDKERGSLDIEISSGALTGIAGSTNHGKTVFLLNLLLNVARRYPDKKFIIFTYEERANRILGYLLNIYLEDLALGERGNRRLIKEYFKYHNTRNFDPKIVDEFHRRKNIFFKTFIESGRILIKYTDGNSSTLCNQLRYLAEKKIGACFIDYMQLVPKNPRSKAPTRQEELKQICLDLKNVANETGLPIVFSCQFNREVLSPSDLQATKVREAGDIEQIMSEMYGLWNMSKGLGRQLSGEDQKSYDTLRSECRKIETDPRTLKETGATGLLIKVLKGRDIPTESQGLLVYRDKTTQRVEPNNPKETIISTPEYLEEDLPY